MQPIRKLYDKYENNLIINFFFLGKMLKKGVKKSEITTELSRKMASRRIMSSKRARKNKPNEHTKRAYNYKENECKFI